VTTSLPGIWPALLTPLDAQGAIDIDRFAGLARGLLDAGCGGVTPFGTTGEGPSFSVAERIAAVEALVARGVPAARILASTSCAAPTDTLALTRHALELGTWASLVMPPFYFKGVSDAGIVDFYAWLVDSVADSRLRIMLYHIPQVAGVGVSQAVIRELLARYPGTFVGIKDSQCELAHSLGLADAFMKTLTVHVGNELDLPALGRLGSTGAVSGLANFLPRTVLQLVAEPDTPATAEALARVKALLGTLGGYALIPALKGIMALRDGDTAWLRVRPTLKALDAAGLERLRADLQRIGFDSRID
jgi:4-hydroxy-tetrahydrodipicolinate synthase